MKILFLLLLFASLSSFAESFNAKVIAVLDGDTAVMKSGGFTAKIRLADIDAPEKDQPYGNESRESLLALIGNKEVQVASRAIDKYGRTVASVSINGLSVNEEQVRRGWAWKYSRSKGSRIYAVLQSEAQQSKRGLWKQSSPQEPSQWRKLHPSVKPMPQAHQQTSTKSPNKPSTFGALACGKKRYCSQMVTCDEAHFYLTVCGVERLDVDGDGVPCEALCLPLTVRK